MSFTINVVTRTCNKTCDITHIDGTFITSNSSNEIIKLGYSDSYILYIQPHILDMDSSNFFDIIHNSMTSFTGFVWVIAIGLLIITFIRLLKTHV